MSKRQRYNIKIPASLRARFLEPHDEFISHLLDLSEGIQELPELVTKSPKVLQADGSLRAPRWTVWLKKQTRDRFQARKDALAPEASQGKFMEMLLALSPSAPIQKFHAPKLDLQPQARSFDQVISPITPLEFDSPLGSEFDSPVVSDFDSLTPTYFNPHFTLLHSLSFNDSYNSLPRSQHSIPERYNSAPPDANDYYTTTPISYTPSNLNHTYSSMESADNYASAYEIHHSTHSIPGAQPESDYN